MALLHILVLAVVQGITEFLPISSSGHLLFISPVTGWPDQGQVIDIAVHMGSLLAVLAYFWKDIFAVANAMLRPMNPELAEGRRLAMQVFVGTLPVIIAGGLLFFVIKIDLRSVLLVAATTVFFGILLGWADKSFPKTKDLRAMSYLDALIIGLVQVFALLPGSSRSGVTMMAARMRGIDRSESAHFSMLLSIPAILGAGILGSLKLLEEGDVNVGMDAAIAAGLSAIVAFCAIGLLMKWIGKIGFMPFVIYRLLLGALLFGLYFLA